ncbi:MAG: hypothetical protein JO097_15630 [Acidobacteriaceae bacterium]|nr:hypothetical protein [Acidobacteriaceae bacterium]MBV9766236.1 hypothetical protein [Acidobacteriaceae bacterium]
MKTRQILVIGVCAFITALGLNLMLMRTSLSRGIAGHTTSSGKISPLARSLRPNYPYSVIAGGAYSPAELKFANEKDPLVRNHYSDFNLRDARLVTLSDDRYQYVSFRLNNRIFWTRKKLRIPKGEVLLTDGYNYARTRCGNRLSSTPKPNTTPLQPSERLLSLPPYSPKLIAQLPFVEAPPTGELVREVPTLPFTPNLTVPAFTAVPSAVTPVESWPPLAIYPPVVPIATGYIPTPVRPRSPGPGTPIIPNGPPNISHVPEPASLSLIGIALCAVLWLLTLTLPRNEVASRTAEED